jgi:L-lysine exporter family protein LysE/ArgO
LQVGDHAPPDVLRQGALRAYVGTVVLICAVSDVALIGAGVAGVGAVVASRPDC